MENTNYEAIYQEKQERFEKFTDELSKLSKKYGVSIDSCGGIFIYGKEDLKNIESVVCTDDSSSGDLFTYFNFTD